MVCAGESLPLSSCWGLGLSGGSHRGRGGGAAGAVGAGTGSEGEAGGDTGTGREGDGEGRVPGERAVGAETRGLTGELGVWGWKHLAKQGL